jgi:hypothetical protein
MTQQSDIVALLRRLDASDDEDGVGSLRGSIQQVAMTIRFLMKEFEALLCEVGPIIARFDLAFHK